MSKIDIDPVVMTASDAIRKYGDKALTLREALGIAAQEDDYALVKEVIRQCIYEAKLLQIDLQDVLSKVVELESVQVRQEQYSEQWCQEKWQTLYKAFKKDPQEGLCQWLQTFSQALIDWELATCEKLANEPFPFPPQAIDVSSRFQNGIQAIKSENYQQVLDMLTYLIQANSASQSQPILDNLNRATLLVFIGRIFHKMSDCEIALKHFEQAKDLSPKDGRPYSALGEYTRLKNDRNKASTHYHQAIELSPEQSDGYIGMGLLSEDQALWDEADDRYEEAIKAVQEEKDIDVALSKLLAPVSGNLFLQLARTLKKKDPQQALRAVERALTLGIKHDGEYPERLGYRLKGEILEKLKLPEAAAEAYYKAGQQFSQRNESQVAVELLTKAQKLSPEDANIHWELTDVLRLSSYLPKAPYVDEALIKKSLDFWEKGVMIEQTTSKLSSGYSMRWIYLERALINEQLARLPNANQLALWWEAITYLERANLLAVDVQIWAILARNYRFLEKDSSARQAIDKALEIETGNKTVLTELVVSLVNKGEVDAIEEVIDKEQKQGPDVWFNSTKALILMHKGLFEESKDYYQEALKILDSTLQTTPEDLWYHDLRAYCYLMLNQPIRAREEYEWIWSQYDPLNTDNLNTFGWAAYNLGRSAEDPDEFNLYIDRAIEIFSTLCKEPVGAGDAYRNLGLSYLCRGDLALGEENLAKGIALLINKLELDVLQKADFYNIEKSSVSWPYGAQVREILAQLNEKINTRRIEVEQSRTVEEELKEVVEEYPCEEGTINWGWIGAHAGLARLYTEEKHWNEATTAYFLLQKEGERFPEAYLGLEKIFDGLQAEGDDRVKKGKPSEALEQFTQILLHELLPDDTTRKAQLYSRLGFVYFDLEDTDSARSYFAKAIQLYHENGTSSPGSALGEVCLSLLRNVTHCRALDAEWKAETDDSSTDEALRSELTAARKLLANYFD